MGSVAVKNGVGDLLTRLFSVYENYISIKTGERAVINFGNSFFKSAVMLILTYSAGLCAVGTPVIYAVPIISGIGIGAISSHMYSAFSLKGIGYCALMVYPSKVVTTVIMITACTFSSVMSMKMLKTLMIGEEELNYRNYNFKYLVLLMFSTVAALIDTVLNLLFAGYFNFQ